MRRSLLALALLAGCSAHGEPIAKASVHVIDGDTIAVGVEHVRFENIDAPEMPAHARCKAEAWLALAARDRLALMLAQASTVELRRVGTDRYGRTLARVLIDGRDAGDALMQAHLAGRWIGHRYDWCTTAGE